MPSLSVAQYVDILMLSETKLDSTFPPIQFLTNDFFFLIDFTEIVKTVASYCMLGIKSLF